MQSFMQSFEDISILNTNVNTERIIRFTVGPRSITVKVKSCRGFAHLNIVGFNEMNQSEVPLDEGFSLTRIALSANNTAEIMTQFPSFGMLTLTWDEGGKLIYNGRSIITFSNTQQLIMQKGAGVTIHSTASYRSEHELLRRSRDLSQYEASH